MSVRNEMITLTNAMEQLVHDTFNHLYTNGNGNGSNGHHLVPRADAWETEEELVVEMALPGVEPDAVEITFEKDSLTISGEFAPRGGGEGWNWILRERRHGKFQRRFTLNLPVDVERAEATCQHGILTLRLPKAEEGRPRRITVKAS